MGRKIAASGLGVQSQQRNFSPGGPEEVDHPDTAPLSRSRPDPSEFPKTTGSGNHVSRLRIQCEEEFQISVFLLGQVIENEREKMEDSTIVNINQ